MFVLINNSLALGYFPRQKSFMNPLAGFFKILARAIDMSNNRCRHQRHRKNLGMIVINRRAGQPAMIMKNRDIFSAIIFGDNGISISISLNNLGCFGVTKLSEAFLVVSGNHQLVKTAGSRYHKRTNVHDRTTHALFKRGKFIWNHDRGPVS